MTADTQVVAGGLTSAQKTAKIRTENRAVVAKQIFTDLIEKEGDDPVYLRELVLLDFRTDSVYDYLKENRDDIQRLRFLLENEWFTRLSESDSEEVKEFVALADSVIVKSVEKEAAEENVARQHERIKRRHIRPSTGAYESEFTFSFGLLTLFFILFCISLSMLVMTHYNPYAIVATIVLIPAAFWAYKMISDVRKKRSEVEAGLQMAQIRKKSLAYEQAREKNDVVVKETDEILNRIRETEIRVFGLKSQ